MAIKQKWHRAKPLRVKTEEALSKIIPLFQSDKRILMVYLFGSRARKTDLEHSDIDLAFYTTLEFQWDDYYLLYSDVTKTLHSDRVDLVWLNHAEPVLSFEVIRSSKVVFYRDPDLLNDYELKTKKRYYDYVIYLRKHRWAREGGI
jgi:predicted nucleotidyltransferase